MEINKEYNNAVMVEQASVGVARNKNKYLDLKLFDGSTSLMGKVWNFSGEAPTVGSIIVARFIMGEYNNAKQITISAWRPLEEADGVGREDFVKHSKLSREALHAMTASLIEHIEDEEYKFIVDTIYAEFKEDFLEAPAALKHHQNYLGGLAEHSIGVATKAVALADEPTNIPLVIAGGLLHDIGKIFTYDWSGTTLAMTDSGKLLDHIALGLKIMQYMLPRFLALNPEMALTPSFRQKLRMIDHVIVSHHGCKEYGSPVTPKFKEAFLVSQADASDATISNINEVLEANDRPWTDYHRDLGGELLRGLVEAEGHHV